MKAPNKIYIVHDKETGGMFVNYDKKDTNNIEYIRKDLLLEWAKEEKDKTSSGLSEYDAGHENARMELLNELIYKLDTL